MDQIEGLFPIPVMRSPGLLPQELIDAAALVIRSAKIETNLRSGQLFHTQVADPRENNLFQEIADRTIPKLIDFGELLFGERLAWSVKEMWTNMLETGGNQTLHSHANSFISGILYLTPSHPASNTVFVRPPGGFEFSFRHHTRSATIGPYNAGKYKLPEIEPGDLVLFPSYLYHEVPTNQGEQRMTIAFNAIPNQLDCWGYRITFAP
ncbi:2OG-Fe(II) oxygenase family protein [Bradyrhizobium sp. ISRA443]|uniref:2OG-Fe(II) oxygenase family protein n=1 Tax=unclassified Bradyrhizobium TaxID=2631580 RepID=UPI002478B80D|nr:MULTISPECIES: 2OG-Fe(II) oxygenase family protein [unclassified Bradyrhizobium]WGR93901.1 2OG-Fe(II) oxygenase family protein [Bradyrhizobium sp. ISRA435]WGR98520.1 2OG-Fe(II) oxygenase family protein [Bradyrhizobium sp. ISRA436]WGS05409.1 2OG-Fe(II) oxygenase family protein [Bradyrhizobium sp. ISRA437]WGS12295.1 2OG-Fe(II) oxygenase family protein [Bradyrhizobium sp. ISRA443]